MGPYFNMAAMSGKEIMNVAKKLPTCPMRDFQTWLITQVTVARGAACQVISELPVCPDYTVYTSQSAEQDNKTHLTGPKTNCAYWL